VEEVELSDAIEWIELPKGKTSRKPIGPPRRAMVTLHRMQGLESLRVERSLLTRIGSPTSVNVLIDTARCRIALQPVAEGHGRRVRDIPHRNHSEISVSGASKTLALAGANAPVRMRAAVVNGMLLMEPIALPQPCPTCNGSGVQK
jgi:hypothetical protein